MDVLDFAVLDAEDVARYLGVTRGQARAALARHARLGEFLRTPDAAWGRLTWVDRA